MGVWRPSRLGWEVLKLEGKASAWKTWSDPELLGKVRDVVLVLLFATKDLTKFQKVFAVKSNVLVFAQVPRVWSVTHAVQVSDTPLLEALPGCIPISVIVTFLADYLATDQGMAVEVRLKV